MLCYDANFSVCRAYLHVCRQYETGSTIVRTYKPYKNWPKIFHNDSTLTSAVLDRLLHQAEIVIVEGRSYRMKDQIGEP